ncbi:MAG TPA: cyclic nucleotide-binding domain-containing protein [bacterium]|nr:cyclic nucleotide-binding domain-containing protein [bacterium]
MEPTSAIFKHLRRVLQQAYFLQFMTTRELDALMDSLRAMRVFKGYEIVRQGDPGDAFYLIASGRVTVWINKGNKRVHVANLYADNYFGEMSLISNAPRNATVIAEGLTELFVLEKHNFERILLKNPNIAQKLKAAYEQRGMATTQIAQSDLA